MRKVNVSMSIVDFIIISCFILVFEEVQAQKFVADGPSTGTSSETGIVSRKNANGYEAGNNAFSGYVSIGNGNHGFFAQFNDKNGFISELNTINGYYSNSNTESGFMAENNMQYGCFAKNNSYNGFRSECNDRNGFSSVGNTKDGFRSNYNGGDGIVSSWNGGYAGAFYGSTASTEASVLIQHNDDSRIDLEFGGHARVASTGSFVFYLDDNNNANESFYITNSTGGTIARIRELGNTTLSPLQKVIIP